MTGPLILAIDQGTNSSRAAVVNAAGAILGHGQRSVHSYYPQPGWVEQDPEEIWRATESAIALASGAAGVHARDISAVGIASQRESVVAWDRATGEPAHPLIGWQDRRTIETCARLRLAGQEEPVRAATGLTIDPYFSATKIAWLLDNVPDLRRRAEAGDIAIGTVDSWLAWKLTDGAAHVTDYTNASRTLLFNTRRGRWDENLCDIFGVPHRLLPSAQPTSSPFGMTAERAFGAAVPITALAGDQQAALYGQACVSTGMAKSTYGTGCFVLANAGRRAEPAQYGLLVSLGPGTSTRGPEYVLEGPVFAGGGALDWLREQAGFARTEDELDALAASSPHSGGLAFVPAFNGLGAPYWDPGAHAALLGLTLSSTRAEIARAAYEGVALMCAEVLLAIEAELDAPVTSLRADGGGARSDLLMQLQADFCGREVIRPQHIESTVLGAAYLAGIEAKVWASAEETAALWQPERTFEPHLGDDERFSRLAGWREAVNRTRTQG